MVKSYEEARKKLAKATKFIPVRTSPSELRASNFSYRLYKYHFIPDYVSPFILDSIPVSDDNLLWVGDLVKAAELNGELPDRSYTIYKDILYGYRTKKLKQYYGWSFIHVKRALKVFLLKHLTVQTEVEKKPEMVYNGYVPGR